MSTPVQRFAAVMKEYLHAVDRVGTAPSSKSYKERVAKERELRVEVEAKLQELVITDEKDQEWLAENKPKPRRKKTTAKKSEPKPEPPSDGFDEEPSEPPSSL